MGSSASKPGAWFGLPPSIATGAGVAVLGSIVAFLGSALVGSYGATGSAMAFGAGLLYAWFIAAPVAAWFAWRAFSNAEDARWWKYALVCALVLLFVFEVIVQGCTAATTPNASDPYCRLPLPAECVTIAS
jgi:hypothetical protein